MTSPKFNNWYPYKERELETYRHMDTRREKRAIRRWRQGLELCCHNQRMLRVAGSYHKLEEARKDSSLGHLEGAWFGTCSL